MPELGELMAVIIFDNTLDVEMISDTAKNWVLEWMSILPA